MQTLLKLLAAADRTLWSKAFVYRYVFGVVALETKIEDLWRGIFWKLPGNNSIHIWYIPTWRYWPLGLVIHVVLYLNQRGKR